MAQECGFFNAQLVGEQYDRVYLAETFAAYFASFVGNGVFGKSMQELEVVGQATPSMKVDVLSGQAWINGYWYRNTDTYTLDISVADGVLSRIDLVVLRWSNSERDMYLTVIEGVPSANPIAPNIRRDADFFDLELAQVNVGAGMVGITQSAITDMRLNKAVCGLVTGLIEQIDLTDLFNQFTQYFTEFKQKYEKDYDTWTQQQKAAYDDWVKYQKQLYESYIAALQGDYDSWTKEKKAEWAQWIAQNEEQFTQWSNKQMTDFTEWTAEQKQAYADWYGVHTEAWEQAFNEWFETIKDKLSGDIAGSLQNQINELKQELPAEVVAEIEHNMDAYVHCDAFETQYACGTQGAGIGPCGGGLLVSTNIKYEMKDRDNIKVMAKAGFGTVEAVNPIGENLYAVVFQQQQVSLVIALSNIFAQYQNKKSESEDIDNG